MRGDTSLFRIFAAWAACVLLVVAPVSAKSNAKGQDTTAVAGKVTGSVQQVGFRALVQKLAIQYNLAGLTENNADKSVQFTLQGDSNRVNQALKAIRKGTKKSSDVNVSTSAAMIDPNLKTFMIIGWTSLSRHITNPYDLVFHVRNPDTLITKGEAKAVWLKICEAAATGEDAGKCDKDNDD